jgi:hypothetical protein
LAAAGDAAGLVNQLRSPLYSQREAAVAALQALPPAALSGRANEFAELLVAGEWPAQEAAGRLLAVCAASAKSVTAQLKTAVMNSLRKKNGAEALLQLATLQKIDPSAASGLSTEIAGLIADQNSEVAIAACHALTILPAETIRPHAGTLLGLIETRKLPAADVAAQCLVAARLNDAAVIPALMGLLADKDNEVAILAARVLAAMETSLKSAVPGLLTEFAKKPEYAKYPIGLALIKCGSEAAPAIVAALPKRSNVKGAVFDAATFNGLVFVLGRIGPAAKAALPALEQAGSLGSTSDTFVADALARIKGQPPVRVLARKGAPFKSGTPVQ